MNGQFIELNFFGEDVTTDTFITNSISSNKRAWDRSVNGYVYIPSTESDSKQLLKNRNYLKVGKISNEEQYRSIIQFNIKNIFSKNTSRKIVSIQKATLTLTKISSDTISSFAIASSSEKIDETASWNFSSEENKKNWMNIGGDFGIISPIQNTPNNKITIDVTDFISEWYTSGKEEVTIFLIEDSSTNVQLFHSSNSASGIAGNQPQMNCLFKTGMDSHSIHTEGIFVNIDPISQGSRISLIDTSESARQQFSDFQEMMSKGNTFNIFDPDLNNNITLQNKVCTILGKNNINSIDVSGISLSDSHQTTLEFNATGKVADKDNFLEISNPTIKLIEDLKEKNTITIEYKTKLQNNNNGDYIITKIKDDTFVNNRILVFVDKKLFSENRKGLETKIIQANITPTLNIEMILF